MHGRLTWTILLCLVVGGGCATTVHDYRGPRMHRSLFEEPRRELPRRVVVLPAQAFVSKLNQSASGDKLKDLGSLFVPDPEASARASTAIQNAVASELEHGSPFELAALPELGAEERASVLEYVALFHDVAWTAANCSSFWRTPDFKLREFDYSLGPGLAVLEEKSDADAGLMVGASGRDLIVGLVDLASGDLLWVNAAKLGEAHDWSDADAVRALFRQLWKLYPGLETFARLRRKA